MRRLQLVVLVAAVSSGLTAAAIAIPAWAEDDKPERDDSVFAPARERIEKFEACMREQGFELGPETTVRITPDGVTINGQEVDAEKFRAAQQECGPLFPALVPGRLELRDAVPGELQERFDRLRSCLEDEES